MSRRRTIFEWVGRATYPGTRRAWARQHSPDAQQMIADAYTSISAELGADLIPAGLASRDVLQLPRHPILHYRDGSHPTVAGSYLAASCAVAALLKADPRGLWAPDGLNAGDATLPQRAAADVTLARGSPNSADHLPMPPR